MVDQHASVRERQAMLAGMTPVLKQGRFHFCSTKDAIVAAAAIGQSLATFREEEGLTLVLDDKSAAAFGFDRSVPMCRIVLEVFSALEGVGLTAAVASALSDHGIPCNVIAAYYHDHVFVPEAMGHQALEILQNVQREASVGTN